MSYNDITPNADTGNILEELKPRGSNGGALFQLNSSIRYDSRDNYNNTAAGSLEEILVEYGIGEGVESITAPVSVFTIAISCRCGKGRSYSRIGSMLTGPWGSCRFTKSWISGAAVQCAVWPAPEIEVRHASS